MNYPGLNASTRWGLGTLLLMVVVFALYFGRAVFVPMTIALLLVAVLWPMASWVNSSITWPGVVSSGKFPWVSFRLVKRPLPWGIACMIVIVVLLAIIVLVPVGMGTAINNMLRDVPRDQSGLDLMYRQFLNRMAEAGLMPPLPQYKLTDKALAAVAAQAPSSEVMTRLAALKDREFTSQEQFSAELSRALDGDAETQQKVLQAARVPPPSAADVPVLQGIQEMLNPEKPAFSEMLKNVLGYGTTWLVEGVLIMFMLLFLLLEGRLLSARLVEIFGPSHEAQGKAVRVLASMAEQVRVYLVWRTIVNFGLALVLGVVYYLMGVKFHWQWALLTALLCYIPYLGQIVAGVPPFVDALLYAPSPWMAPAVLAVYIVAMTIEGYVIVPLVMGRSMQLNAITVLLACSFWFLVWGVPGLFLAMPLMAAIKAICQNVPGWEAWANLMSTVEPVKKPPEPEPAAEAAAPAAEEAADYMTDTEVMTPEEAQAHRAALEAMKRERQRS